MDFHEEYAEEYIDPDSIKGRYILGGVQFLIFTLPVFSATINIRKILTFNFR